MASKAIAVFEEKVKLSARADFVAKGGCETCKGRGWVVTWDTLDSLSGAYAEYGACKNVACTASTVGLDHSCQSKYDIQKGTTITPMSAPADIAVHAKLSALLASERTKLLALQDTAKIAKGKKVEVFRQNRSYQPAKGTQGIIFWIGTDKFGGSKVGFKDAAGTVFWSPEGNLNVIDATVAKPKLVLIAGQVKKESTNAFGLEIKNFKDLIWLPKSQVKRLNAVGFLVPEWLAKNNKLIK